MTSQTARRILIVEDEVLLAMHLEDLLTALGHQVVAQATRVGPAMELARTCDIDFAVLDINVAGANSFPVAAVLRARGIRFAFATGYGVEGLVDGYRDCLALRKPYGQEDLERTIAEVFAGSSRRSALGGRSRDRRSQPGLTAPLVEPGRDGEKPPA